MQYLQINNLTQLDYDARYAVEQSNLFGLGQVHSLVLYGTGFTFIWIDFTFAKIVFNLINKC